MTIDQVRLLERLLRDLPPDHLRELAGLLSRAAHCFEQGWPEAAIDSIGRALGLLEEVSA